MPFSHDDWELLWPRHVFSSEASAVLLAADDDYWIERRDLLLREALTPRAARQFEGLTIEQSKTLLNNVISSTSTLRLSREHRAYFSERSGGGVGRDIDEVQLRSDVSTLLHNLRALGYFEQAIPYSSIDSHDTAAAIDLELHRKSGTPGLWQVAPLSWTGSLFFDVVEVFHDLVARPRLTWHDASAVLWRFDDFNQDAGQELFRFWINGLFERSPLPYRLSESGEDVGRLVLAESNEEHAFFEAMSNRSDPTTAGEVRHAIASFRARGVTREQKRSAVLSLARILEERKPLLEASLRRRDESTLFQIANKFDIRHRDGLQQSDYDDAFLDWMFRWYLATIELSDKLIARGGT
jgi:hypothetical protein